MSTRHQPVVAALDLGTSYSGYALAFRADPDDILLNKSLGKDRYRTATCILTEKGSKGKYLDFGDNARNQYNADISNTYELYDNFKMILYHEKSLSHSVKVQSVRGTERPLMDVFVMLIEAFAQNALKVINSKVELDPGQVIWVITVPAIWSDAAKQFMEAAARKAWIPQSNTLFLSEAEAAAFHCMGLGINNFHKATEHYFSIDFTFTKGKRYMLVDAGGGTVDIAVHEIQGVNSVKEVYQSTGGPWGGTQVNAAFSKLMERVMGKDFVETFQKQHSKNWYDFLMQFEDKKRSSVLNKGITIAIPLQMERAFRNYGALDERIKSTSTETGVTESNGYLILNEETTNSLFKPVVDSIINHIDELLLECPEKPDYIFLVGGFGDSIFLKTKMQEHFSRHIVLIPDDAEFAVMKGAVKYGVNPKIMSARKAKATYGVGSIVKFVSGTHDPSKQFETESGLWCMDVFIPLIQKGDDIRPDTVGSHGVTSVSSELKEISLTFHSTSKIIEPTEVLYTDSPGVLYLGKIVVNIPRHSDETTLKIAFGDTLIQASTQATDGKERRVEIKFLTEG